jgi:DNA polymerase elongation subunit (family B)
MVMKLEKIVSLSIFTGKKRYIMRVLSSEGVEYKIPKLVIKGMEAIKSSTPKVCREEFKEMFEFLLTGSESDVQNRVLEFEKIFKQEQVHKIAFPKSVSNVTKYENKTGPLPYKKGHGVSTPINSRSAIIYNKMVKDLGLTRKYPLIRNGDRLKYVYLKKNNPTKENVIGFIDKLPPEFDLDRWVDYDIIYDKTYVTPLQLILNAIGWKATAVSSLESFFS